MGRSVSDAAAQAVAKSNKKEAVQLTPEQVITNIRKDVSQGLFVQPANWKVLLAEYTRLQFLFAEAMARVVGLKEDVVQLREQNDQFLKVYAAENQPNTTVSFFEPPTEGETAPTPGSGE